MIQEDNISIFFRTDFWNSSSLGITWLNDRVVRLWEMNFLIVIQPLWYLYIVCTSWVIHKVIELSFCICCVQKKTPTHIFFHISVSYIYCGRWRHYDVIGSNEYLISTLSEFAFPWVYSLQLLFKSTYYSRRYERKCERVLFSEHSIFIFLLASWLLVHDLDWSVGHTFVTCVLSRVSSHRCWYSFSPRSEQKNSFTSSSTTESTSMSSTLIEHSSRCLSTWLTW